MSEVDSGSLCGLLALGVEGDVGVRRVKVDLCVSVPRDQSP